MAIQAQAPVVPVAVTGGRAAMRKGSPVVRPVTMRVRIGEPVETAGLTVDDRDALIARGAPPGAGAARGGVRTTPRRWRADRDAEPRSALAASGAHRSGGGRRWTH